MSMLLPDFLKTQDQIDWEKRLVDSKNSYETDSWITNSIGMSLAYSNSKIVNYIRALLYGGEQANSRIDQIGKVIVADAEWWNESDNIDFDEFPKLKNGLLIVLNAAQLHNDTAMQALTLLSMQKNIIVIQDERKILEEFLIDHEPRFARNFVDDIRSSKEKDYSVEYLKYDYLNVSKEIPLSFFYPHALERRLRILDKMCKECSPIWGDYMNEIRVLQDFYSDRALCCDDISTILKLRYDNDCKKKEENRRLHPPCYVDYIEKVLDRMYDSVIQN